MDISGRIISNFDYVKKAIEFEALEEEEEDERIPDIELSSLGKRVLEQYKDKQKIEFEEKMSKQVKMKKKEIDLEEVLSVQDFLEERKERGDWLHERHLTGGMAHSVTSTYVTLKTSDEKRQLSDLEMLRIVWMEIKSYHHKSYIQMETNLGELNIELYSDQAVRTCYSFLDLIYKGTLDGMKFKKLVSGTVLLLENQTSRGIKLDTVDRSEKLFHKKPALLTIDTLGDLNTFGITLAPASLLDRTNSI